jgi:uncharacterized coiled-coil protein SlyX
MNMAGMTDSELSERFLKLETKAAYQEKLLAELSDVILDRGREIDRLTVRVTALERQYEEGQNLSPGHEPPPHY